MAKPVAPAQGIAFSFPDVCQTPAPGVPPIPYPNVAQLDSADAVSNDSGKELLVGPGLHVLLGQATVQTSSGDEAGSVGGVVSRSIKGPAKLVQASATVLYGASGKGIVRFMDATTQNQNNSTGFVLSAFPSVLVGD